MDNQNKIYDIIIIGSGPAGLTAALYAGRAELKALMIEKGFAGGQVINTYEVDNYPGLPELSGIELSMKLGEHADKFGIEKITDEVKNIDINEKIKIVETSNGKYQTKTVILATGAQWRKLGVDGEETLRGKGVSYCATCDGAFFRNKVTAVIGGGDTAVEDAIYLSRFCKKVYLVHRRDELRAVKVLQQKLFGIDKIEVIWDSQLTKIVGDDKVNGIDIINKKTKEKSHVDVDGVFIAVGTVPNSTLLKEKVLCNDNGYIMCNENCETSVAGVFAAGDVRKKLLRQIITASADGAIAVTAAEKHILDTF